MPPPAPRPAQPPVRVQALRATAIRAAVLAALLPALPAAHGLTYTWIGGSAPAPNSWANALNWEALQRPISAADTVLVFANAFVATNDLGAGFLFNQINAFAGSAPVAPGTVGTLLGQPLAPAGANARITVGANGVLSISAPLVGGAAWTKAGGGDLLLGGTNVGASGEVTVAAGRLLATASGTLGTGAVNVASGATLRTGGTQLFGGMAGTGAWLADGTVTLANAGTERSFGGSVSGSASLVKTGAGRQVFSGDVALAGSVSVGGGELALNGAAARWAGSTAVTVSGRGTAAVLAGAQWTAIGDLVVGSSTTGDATSELKVFDGSVFTAANGFIGRLAGDSGRVTVSGGARWVTSGELRVGDGGTGQAFVVNNAVGSAQRLLVGGNTSAKGTLVIDGGSRFAVAQTMSVGFGGTGLVQVGPGSVLTTGDVSLGGLLGGNGELHVQGAGSRWTAGEVVIGEVGRGLLSLGQGATATTASVEVGPQAWTSGSARVWGGGSWSADVLAVGRRGTGTVTVEEASSLTTRVGSLGSAGGTGTVIVAGGSAWNNSSSLYVGGVGRGVLQVRDGSIVNASDLRIGLFESQALVPSPSLVELDNGRMQIAGQITVGSQSDGRLHVINGGVLTSGATVIGEELDTHGEMLVMGRGAATSTWNGGSLVVGSAGSGTLALVGKAQVTVGATQIGRFPIIGGLMTLNAADLDSPKMTVNGELWIGAFGPGRLEIVDGHLSSHTAVLSRWGGQGTVVVGGASPGSARWDIQGDLYVGENADPAVWPTSQLIVGAGTNRAEVSASGTLRIGLTGRVDLISGKLAAGILGDGVVERLNWTGGMLSVTGAQGVTLGSSPLFGPVLVLGGTQHLNVAATLNVGSGTIVLRDQAQVSAGTLQLAGGQIVGTNKLALGDTRIEGHGLVGIVADARGGSSALVATGGTLVVGNANDAAGYIGGGLAAARTGSRLVLASAGTVTLGNVSLEAGSALQTLVGAWLPQGQALAAGAGATVVGDFTNDGLVDGPVDGTLSFDDAVTGSGRFTGNVRFAQRFAPGMSTTLQNMLLTRDTVLSLDLLGAAWRVTPRLAVSGQAVLGGVLELSFTSPYTPDAAGDSLRLIDWGGYSGRFVGYTVTGLGDAWTAELDYGADALRLNITPVPEPATWWLLLAGSAGVLARRRAMAGVAGAEGMRRRSSRTSGT